MRKVSSDVATVDQVRKDAFDFIQIYRYPEPLESICYVGKRDLVLVQNDMDPLEKITIGDCLALLEQQVRALPVKLFREWTPDAYKSSENSQLLPNEDMLVL